MSTGPLAHFCKGEGGASVYSPPGVNPQHWRRYGGGARGEIWIDPVGSGDFRRITPVAGNISSPLLCAGRVYFVFDDDGKPNLFSCDLEGLDLRRQTSHEEFAVHSPATDGARIVYCAGADLYVLDPHDGPTRIDIGLAELPEGRRKQSLPVGKDLRDVDGSGRDESIACCAFGSVFEYTAAELDVKKIKLPGYCSHVSYLHDGRLLVVRREAAGDKLIIVSADRGRHGNVRTDRELGRILTLAAPASGSFVLVTNNRQQVLSINVESGATVMLDNSTHRAVEQADISDDGTLCVYALPAAFHRTILRVAQTDGGGIVWETDPPLADFSPSFRPDGSVLFLSLQTRAEPDYELFTTVNLLTPPVEGDAGSVRGTWRVRRLPAPEASFAQAASVHGEAVLLLRPEARAAGGFKGNGQPTPLSQGGGELRLWGVVADRICNFGSEGFVTQAGSELRAWRIQEGELVSHTFEVEPASFHVEFMPGRLWQAAFRDAWRLAAEHVFPAALEASGWDEVGRGYATLVERVCAGRDFVGLLNEMLGRLGLSHAFAREPRGRTSKRQGLLGVEVEFDETAAAWRVNRVPRFDGRVRPPWGLADPAGGAVEGELLVSIDGQALSEQRSPHSQLVGKAGRRVRYELEGPGGSRREAVFDALADERPLHYAAWVFERRRLVSEMTGGAVVYTHLPDVSPKTRADVERWLWCHEEARALIVDVRYNEGGTYGGEIAELLSRRPIAFVRTRWSAERALPAGAGVRPVAVLTNRFTSSGGELLAETLRQLAGGRVVGEQTFGGGIGNTFSRWLADGSSLLLPEIEIARPHEWARVENRGVLPDVSVDWQEKPAPHDPCLLKALRELDALHGTREAT
ncbi:MAG: S41 family peptidase [Pyrinomonadaceae bacterium]